MGVISDGRYFGWALFRMGVISDGRYFGWVLFRMGVISDGCYFGWALFRMGVITGHYGTVFVLGYDRSRRKIPPNSNSERPRCEGLI